jgi:hypothetical protein
MTFGIPPNSYTQKEVFEQALAMQRTLIGPESHIGFNSYEEVANYLNKLGFRPEKPVTAKTVKHWAQTYRFWYTRIRGKFFTTNLHLYALLWQMRHFKKPQRSIGDPMK